MSAVTGWLPAVRLEQLERALGVAQKQAAKLGVEPMRLRELSRENRKVKSKWNDVLRQWIPIFAEFVEVEVVGELPKLPGGWKLVGVLNLEDGAPFVKCVPGEEMPAGERARGGVCDHCETKRVRADTFVLRAEDGRVIQVGRNCLGDFLGLSALKPELLLAVVAFLSDPLGGLGIGEDEWDGEEYGGPRGRTMLGVLEVVTIAGACIDEEGWVSRKAVNEGAGRAATAESVGFVLWPPKNPDREETKKLEAYRTRMTEELRGEAVKAIEWARGVSGNDYLENLRVVANCEAVGVDKLGTTVSLMATYRREQERLRERAREEKSGGRGYVGEAGKRMKMMLRLVATPRAIEGAYGTTYRSEFEDSEGRTVVWWASSDPCCGGREGGWKIGEVREVKASVKKHEAYRGRETTVVTRVS